MGIKGSPAAPACRREIMPKWEYSSHSSLPGFDRRAHGAQRANPRVAHIGENHFARAAGCHHLVIDQVRGGARQDQVFASLADDFMPGREGDQVRKTGQIDTVSIMDKLGDCFGERTKFCHEWFDFFRETIANYFLSCFFPELRKMRKRPVSWGGGAGSRNHRKMPDAQTKRRQ